MRWLEDLLYRYLPIHMQDLLYQVLAVTVPSLAYRPVLQRVKTSRVWHHPSQMR
jgi:hypothetical protein